MLLHLCNHIFRHFHYIISSSFCSSFQIKSWTKFEQNSKTNYIPIIWKLHGWICIFNNFLIHFIYSYCSSAVILWKISVLWPIASPALFLKQTGNKIPVCLYAIFCFRNTLPVENTRHSSFDHLNCAKTEKGGLGGLVMV